MSQMKPTKSMIELRTIDAIAKPHSVLSRQVALTGMAR